MKYRRRNFGGACETNSIKGFASDIGKRLDYEQHFEKNQAK